MCCVLELFVFFTGLAALLRGRVNLYGSGRVVEGTPATIVGLLLMAPFCVVFALGFLRGMEAAQAGKQPDFESVSDLAGLELLLYPVCLLPAGIISVCYARKPVSLEDLRNADADYIRRRASA